MLSWRGWQGWLDKVASLHKPLQLARELSRGVSSVAVGGAAKVKLQ